MCILGKKKLQIKDELQAFEPLGSEGNVKLVGFRP